MPPAAPGIWGTFNVNLLSLKQREPIIVSLEGIGTPLFHLPHHSSTYTSGLTCVSRLAREWNAL